MMMMLMIRWWWLFKQTNRENEHTLKMTIETQDVHINFIPYKQQIDNIFCRSKSVSVAVQLNTDDGKG